MSSTSDKVKIINSDNVLSTIDQIASTTNQEDAFYICDLRDIVRKQEKWKTSFPRVQSFYAVKCNDDEQVLKALALLNVNFDCASKAEILKVLTLGVSPDRIIFANPAKSVSDLKFASTNNVSLLTFDCEEELVKVKAYYPQAKMVIRIRSDASDSMCQLGLKFGCESSEAVGILKKAKYLAIDVVGVCFHVGSGCQEPEAYARAIEKSSELFKLAESECEFKFNLLDIGGGYPGEKGTSLDEYAQIINCSLSKHFPEDRYRDLRIISEPGRFYVSSAFTLATRISTVRIEDGVFIYHINDGSYGSFSIVVFYGMEPVIPVPLRKRGEELFLSTFWGPTYDHYDLVAQNVMFPKMDVGDWMIFEDKGSYTLPLCTRFHGFDVPEVYYVADQETRDLLLNN